MVDENKRKRSISPSPSIQPTGEDNGVKGNVVLYKFEDAKLT
jgi:hypothetical protein